MGVVVHTPEDGVVDDDMVRYCEVVTGAGGPAVPKTGSNAQKQSPAGTVRFYI